MGKPKAYWNLSFMEGFKGNSIEKTYDPFLKELWAAYGFPHNPPFSGSVAEKRLKNACDKYSDFIDRDKNKFAGDEIHMYGIKKISDSETARRELHNQIAIMTVGKLRTGMEMDSAKNIADFAYEYSKGDFIQ